MRFIRTLAPIVALTVVLTVVIEFCASSAQAVPVWNYRLQGSQVIVRGTKYKVSGKLKLAMRTIHTDYRTVGFKYKLSTPMGTKNDWLPYNLPNSVFEPGYLAGLAIGEQRPMGTVPHGWERRTIEFTLTRNSDTVFSLATPGARIKFVVNPNDLAAWTRVEAYLTFDTSTVALSGNFLEATDEN